MHYLLTALFLLSYVQVCERHFKPEHLRTTSTYTDVDGRTIEVPMKITRITSDAVPTLFPDCPSYLSATRQSREEPEVKRRRNENAQLQEAIQQSAAAFEMEEAMNKIQSLEDISARLQRLHQKDYWTNVCCDKCIIFAHLEPTTQAPELLASVTVSADMCVRVFWKHVQLASNEELEIPGQVLDFRVLERLLDNVQGYCTDRSHQKQDRVSAALKLIVALLDDISDDEITEHERADALFFLKEQFELMGKKNNGCRYSAELLVLSAVFHTISPHAYNFLRSSGKVVLPHATTIKRVCAAQDVSPSKEQTEEGFLRYMKRRAGLLNPHERNIVLMMDEIHLQQFFEYKGGRFTGAAANCAEPAKTAHVFMVQSLLSSYKDVAHILPVSRITAEELHRVLRGVIMNLEDAGLHVVAVITDNNSINRKVMSLFGRNHKPLIVYPHPAQQQLPLFHIIDTVHLLKCIRNNWLNQKTCDKCLYFPPFESEQEQGVKMQGASFTSLKKLYEAEQDSVVKVAYGLTYKSLNPTNLERQNVKLAMKIFSSFVSSALRLRGTELKLILPEETAEFIDLVLRWWNIVNVKTPQKGWRLRDPWQEPISAMSCKQIEFLDKFATWLDNWKSRGMQTGTLTNETHSALRQSTYALIEVARYCLDELGFKYVLLGKFQTDALEARFGKYRRLCGSHYNVSITEVFEAETKIRIQNTLLLKDFTDSSKEENEPEPCPEALIKKIQGLFI